MGHTVLSRFAAPTTITAAATRPVAPTCDANMRGYLPVSKYSRPPCPPLGAGAQIVRNLNFTPNYTLQNCIAASFRAGACRPQLCRDSLRIIEDANSSVVCFRVEVCGARKASLRRRRLRPARLLKKPQLCRRKSSRRLFNSLYISIHSLCRNNPRSPCHPLGRARRLLRNLNYCSKLYVAKLHSSKFSGRSLRGPRTAGLRRRRLRPARF